MRRVKNAIDPKHIMNPGKVPCYVVVLLPGAWSLITVN